MPSIDRLFAEQDELRAICVEMRDMTMLPAAPARVTVSGLRWKLARALLRHLPQKDRLVYARLRRHEDPAIAAIGQRYSEEAALLYAGFRQHTERWTPEAVERDWANYGAGVQQMTHLLEDRIAREEAELLPHLAGAPEVEARREENDRNWAADGWRIRALLEIDEPGSVAA